MRTKLPRESKESLMSAELSVLVQRLAADPLKLGSLTAEQACALREHLEAALGADSAVTPAAAPTPAPLPGPAWGPDDLLTVDEVSATLQMSRQWVYRQAKKWPFTCKLSPKVLRFSRAGLVRWLGRNRP